MTKPLPGNYCRSVTLNSFLPSAATAVSQLCACTLDLQHKMLFLQEKTIVAAALQKCKDRAAVNFTLAEKLNKLIGQSKPAIDTCKAMQGVLAS